MDEVGVTFLSSFNKMKINFWSPYDIMDVYFYYCKFVIKRSVVLIEKLVLGVANE